MSKRIKRVNQLIQQEISQLLLREIDLPKDILVTVTRVETAPNLSNARVFLSVLPEENKDKVISLLDRKIYSLQQKINKRLVMKRVPKIEFKEEERTAQAARIEKILEELKKEKK